MNEHLFIKQRITIIVQPNYYFTFISVLPLCSNCLKYPRNFCIIPFRSVLW